MLAACSSSGGNKGINSAPDPVIETRTVIRTVCPAEITAPVAPRPEPGADARLTGNDAGMAWLAAILARLGLLEDRLADAGSTCP